MTRALRVMATLILLCNNAVVGTHLLHMDDLARAEQIVPRDEYRGGGGLKYASVLNKWLESGQMPSRECESFDFTGLRSLLEVFFEARDPRFDQIYQNIGDNRRLRVSGVETFNEELNEWQELDSTLKNSEEAADKEAASILRDGMCYQTAMWFVHHLREDTKSELAATGIEIPLLPRETRTITEEDASNPSQHHAYRARALSASDTTQSCGFCHCTAGTDGCGAPTPMPTPCGKGCVAP